jgi:acyloxyacyl hydrolase
VVLFGLIDGQILWNHMNSLKHPLSAKGGNITYAQFYSFLTCSGMNPCNTFLNNDPTMRNAASQRTKELDQIIKKIAQTKFTNFDLAYIDFEELLELAFARIEKEKRPVSDLIDAIDGFHPSIRYVKSTRSK